MHLHPTGLNAARAHTSLDTRAPKSHTRSRPASRRAPYAILAPNETACKLGLKLAL